MIESPRQELDQAIDRVATRMVAAPGADDFLQQVIARLPEREPMPWFMTMRVQLAAAAAIVVVAFLYARPAEQRPPMAPDQVATAPTGVRPPAPVSASAAVPVASRVVTALRQVPLATRDDHERSLPPVGAIEALELTEIAAPAMELDAPATLAPLVLSELILDLKGDR